MTSDKHRFAKLKKEKEGSITFDNNNKNCKQYLHLG